MEDWTRITRELTLDAVRTALDAVREGRCSFSYASMVHIPDQRRPILKEPE